MSVTPTARCLAECIDRRWYATVVERYNSYTKRSNDAFGFGDILVMDGLPGSLLIQATSTGNMSSRLKKIIGECAKLAQEWLRCDNRIEVWGWAKRGPAGKRKLWTLKTRVVTLGDFE